MSRVLPGSVLHSLFPALIRRSRRHEAVFGCGYGQSLDWRMVFDEVFAQPRHMPAKRLGGAGRIRYQRCVNSAAHRIGPDPDPTQLRIVKSRFGPLTPSMNRRGGRACRSAIESCKCLLIRGPGCALGQAPRNAASRAGQRNCAREVPNLRIRIRCLDGTLRDRLVATLRGSSRCSSCARQVGACIDLVPCGRVGLRRSRGHWRRPCRLQGRALNGQNWNRPISRTCLSGRLNLPLSLELRGRIARLGGWFRRFEGLRTHRDRRLQQIGNRLRL